MGDDKITESAGVLLVRWAGLPAAGAVVVLLVKVLASWLVTLPWAPLQGPARLIDSMPEPWATVGALGIGAVGGLVLSLMAHGDRLTVTVSPTQVRLTGDNYDVTVNRADVAAVFVDRNQLVLLGHDTAELVRRASELDVAALKAAFIRYDFPWRDGDPHAGEYRRWVPDMDGLPPGANALLAERATKLGSADARELRDELLRLGVVVRDDKKKQYWRLVP